MAALAEEPGNGLLGAPALRQRASKGARHTYSALTRPGLAGGSRADGHRGPSPTPVRPRRLSYDAPAGKLEGPPRDEGGGRGKAFRCKASLPGRLPEQQVTAGLSRSTTLATLAVQVLQEVLSDSRVLIL